MNMNNVKKYAVIAGASAALGGCSSPAHHESAHTAPSFAPKANTSSAPNPNQVYPITAPLDPRYTRIAQIAHRLETNFVQNIHEHSVQVKQALGVCAVIAYKRPGDKDTSAIVAPNPVALDTLDKQTGISISIAAAFDPSTQTIVFGPVRTAYEDAQGGIHTKTLAGQNDETDMFPPQIQASFKQQSVEWSAKKGKVIDASTGKDAMQVASFSILGHQSLKQYAGDSLSQLVCMAGMQEAGLISPDQPA
jgi:hypothetical protein